MDDNVVAIEVGEEKSYRDGGWDTRVDILRIGATRTILDVGFGAEGGEASKAIGDSAKGVWGRECRQNLV